MANPIIPDNSLIPGQRLLDGTLITNMINAINLVASQSSTSSNIFLHGSAATTLTAAGTTLGTALALTSQINNVTTAAASTGVALPAISTVGIGTEITIFNNGASPIKVYGPSSNTIDGTAGATGVTLTNALRCKYVAVSATAWLSFQLGVVSA